MKYLFHPFTVKAIKLKLFDVLSGDLLPPSHHTSIDVMWKKFLNCFLNLYWFACFASIFLSSIIYLPLYFSCSSTGEYVKCPILLVWRDSEPTFTTWFARFARSRGFHLARGRPDLHRSTIPSVARIGRVGSQRAASGPFNPKFSTRAHYRKGSTLYACLQCTARNIHQ